MRLAFLAVMTAAFTVGPLHAQTGPWANKLFDKTSHDFGSCPRGAQLKHRFHLKNIYKVPLHITDIRVTCGCMSYEPSTKVIPPRGEAHIDVIMDGRRFSGHKVITMYVTFGPEYVSTAAITVSANARQDVVFNPGSISFGVVQRGESLSRHLDIEYSGQLDWRILEIVKSRSAPIEVAIEETYREVGRFAQPNRVGYRMTVTLRKDAKPGNLQHNILIKTNDPETRNLIACIEGNIQAALSVSPKRLDLGTVKLNTEISRKVIVRSPRAFRIVSIGDKDAGVRTKIPDRSARFHVVALNFQPGRVGRFEKDLVVETDIGETAVITIRATVEP